MSMITVLFRGEREITTEVDVHLQAEKGRELARMIREVKDLKDQHKAAREQEKSELAAIVQKIEDLAKIVAEGKELRLVTVEERGDHESGRVKVYRMDTGQQLYDRPMTPEERQLPIESIGTAPPDIATQIAQTSTNEHESSTEKPAEAPKPCEACGILLGVDGPEDQRVTLEEPCTKCGSSSGWRVVDPEQKPDA